MTFQNLRQLDLNLLLVLEALIRERHVTRAAQRLGLTQSAVSHALGRLRHHFGDPLFIREGRAMIPTSFTQGLQFKLQEILHDIDGLSAQRVDFDPAISERTFIVGLPDYVAISLMSDLSAYLAKKAPNIQIITINVNKESGPQKLQDGDADLVIGRFINPPQNLSLSTLFEEDYVCMARCSHHIVKNNKIALDDYLAERHMHISLAGQDYGLVDEYLSGMNLKRKIQTTLSNYMLGLTMIENSDLILTEPRHTVTPLAQRLNVCICDTPFQSPRFEVVQLWHHKHDHDPAHQWLREQIRFLAGNM